MIALYLAIAGVVGYVLGSISFTRILYFLIHKKDITTVGSKNPGSMNVLRNAGIGTAILTLISEAIKVGAPALACFFIFKIYFPGYENLAFFLLSFCGVVGHCFPVFYRFKGGKGIACAFGMFLFHPSFWWVALVVFAVCFLLFLFVHYGFVVSLTLLYSLTIYATCFFAIGRLTLPNIIVLVLLWMIVVLITGLHYKNFYRFFKGTENKVDLIEKMKVKKNKTESKQNSESSESQKVEEIDNVKPTDQKKTK